MTTETQTKTVSDMAKRFILAEQFATEWLLVAENDQETYTELMQNAREADGMVALSDKLREEWETLAEQVVDLVRDKISETASLFIAQILQGQGSLPFDIIARETLHNLGSSLLKTGKM